MRNFFLIVRREYRERVRTKSFIVTTLLTPVLMIIMMVLPSVPVSYTHLTLPTICSV